MHPFETPFSLNRHRCSISYPADLVFRLLATMAPHIPSSEPAAQEHHPRHRYASTMMAKARRGLVATAAASRAKAAGPSKKKASTSRRRRGSVERVGVSISCRYNPANGFFVRVTPWLFVLPGLQLLARLVARLFNFFFVPADATAAATAAGEKENEKQTEEGQRHLQQQLLASASARRFKVRKESEHRSCALL